ncbi:MAG TPA: type I restriction-modification system subunit M [Pyrinomonadaceae bacterium]|nr:type I restriction-modification system subunit M [Pyrinomonadaceae bacterium]
MALKKSDLYSSLWASCDELRGGMDASQYKDYVLVMLFIKYVSDKYAGVPFAPVSVPPGSSFADLVALKGQPDIGDKINTDIIAPLARENRLSDMPDFNDSTKLGEGKDKVDRLTNLIAIFENPALNFRNNRADGDDILGDAYEYLMRHFAIESGRSRGQFYTPAEVSRIIAKVIGIRSERTTNQTTVYDPTCGSGSLLLKVSDEANAKVNLYGQEKEATTSGLARMNMILHDNAGAVIEQGNTLANPKFVNGNALTTFDFVVANPPFSDKRWSNGVSIDNDPYERFTAFGSPPAKQGDYAYLLHIVRSLKSNGKGACILPHGVLFRGNAEAVIREKLVRRGYIKAIIGLPANLFYGTGIPACIIVLDKEDAHTRKGIFLIDASRGFAKDGPKNRLREQDIHLIVDVFNKRTDLPKYSRMVSHHEIEKNDFNLNLPRYIDGTEPEDIQDIDGHLNGGIPERDTDALEAYWKVCPGLKGDLFKLNRPGYLDLRSDTRDLKKVIHEHFEFATFISDMDGHYTAWKEAWRRKLQALSEGFKPKEFVVEISEDILGHYDKRPLIDRYDIYQILMDYWAETMQDDCYIISENGWKAETYRIIEKDKKGKEKDKGWACDLVPKDLIVARYFAAERKQIEDLEQRLAEIESAITELEEEHGGDDGAFSDLGKINKANVKAQLKDIRNNRDLADEVAILKKWLELSDAQAEVKKKIKAAEVALDKKAYDKYPTLTPDEVKALVIDDKWFAALEKAIRGETDRVSQTLTGRIRQLAERYATPLPQLTDEVAALAAKVNSHLNKMGFHAFN